MKHINLTQMLQGCSKRNGMTVSASGSDGAQTSEVKRQTLSSKKEKWSKNEALSSTCLRSALVPLSFRSRYLRYAAVIFCVLAMNVGQVWGETTLFDVNFADETTETISTSNSGATYVSKTYDGYSMSFGVKNGKSINITNGTGVDFADNNYDAYQQLAIPLTGLTTQKVTVVITLHSAGTIKYAWASGNLPATPTAPSASTYSPSGKINTLEYTPTSSGNYVLYLGRSGSGNGSQYIESIVITQAEPASTYGIARDGNSWTPANELMYGSGTVVSRTLSLAANTKYAFKVVNTDGNTWYGNGEVFGGTKTQSVSSTGTANNCQLLTTEAGDYKFEFNTSSKDLTITYPNSYTYYYANTDSWSKVCVYKYTSISGTTGKEANWPGTEIASPSFTCGGVDYYEASSSGYKTIIFNNGVNGGSSEKKTGNMTVSSSDEGKYVGGTGSSWTALTCNVTYNANGGTGSVPTDATNYSSGALVPVKDNTNLAKSGYYFAGWNTKADGSGTTYVLGQTFEITTCTTLYAKWVAVSCPDGSVEGTVFKLQMNNVGTKKSIAANEYINTAIYATMTNGSAIYGSTAASKAEITNANPGKLRFGGDAVSLKLNLGCPLQAGDIISFTAGESVELSFTTTSSRATTPATSSKSYTIPGGSALIGASTVYCWRSSGSTVNVTSLTITRPASGCTAPTGLAAGSTSAKGTTFTITDEENTNDYEIVCKTTSGTPAADATPTYTSTSKTKAVTDLVAGTKYYAWVRSKCSASNKSDWVSGDNFTTNTVTVTHTLTNVTETSSAATSGVGGSDYVAVYEADEDYALPTPVVTIGGNTATSGTDYTWTAGTGTISIPANKITGNIVITMNSAAAAPTNVAITGNYHIYPGDDLDLTATPTGGNGPKTYQWQKYMGSKWTDLDGETSNTYTKENVNTTDVGQYRCKVSQGGSAYTASDAYNVKCLQLDVRYNDKTTLKTNVAFTKVDATHATVSVELENGDYTFYFKVHDGCNNWYGNNGTMTSANHSGWTLDKEDYCGLTTGKAAYYVFNLDISAGIGNSMVMSVDYPSANQEAGKVIYLDNSVLNWTGSSLYYRIGHNSNNSVTQMTLVPGTANLYKVTTSTWNNFAAWHIANAAGQSGSYSVYDTKSGTAITAATRFDGDAVTSASVTVTPGEDHSTGGSSLNNNCEFYSRSIMNGMKTDRVTITEPSNGTITVNYTNTSNVASTLTCGYADLAHTVRLTSITAVPNTGYDAGAITINGSAYSANYVVTGETTIAASFTPQTYTISYKDQGNVTYTGSNLASLPTSHTYGVATALLAGVKTGYTFVGWFTDAECTVSAGMSIGTTAITADITLYAKWTAKQTTITIDANTGNHGSTAPSSITATYGSELPSFTAATGVSGYSLTGYFTEATSGTKVINANGTLVASTDYADASGNWKYETATLTLYPQYEEAPAPSGDCGEIIKSTFGGTKNTSSTPSTTTFNTTGEIGGTSTSAIIGDNGKLNEEGAYLMLELSTGTFLAGDTIKISSDKKGGVKFATGTPASYTLIGTASTATSGGQPYYFVLAANADNIIIPRGSSSSDYNQNPKIAYVSVHRPCPECDAAPSAPTATSNGATAATTQVVNWTDGSNDKWDVYVSPSSSTPAAGVTPTASGLTAKTYTFTGLTASTIYYWWVRSVCDDTHKSSWFAGSSFTTSAAPAGTTYYLVTSTAQLNAKDTYIIANSDGTAVMSTTTADTNKNPDDITSGFSVDGSTLTVTSASPNLFKLTSATYGWLFRGGNGSGKYISSNSTPGADLWYNASDAPDKNTGEWAVSFASGIATMKLGKADETTYHIYYDATNTKFIQSATASNIKIYTSAAPVGAPVITDQPDLSEVALGGTASFSLTATGATSYQWYNCDSEGENKTEVSGATEDNYSYTTTATGTTYYICKVSNASGDTWSDVVGSIVNPVSFTIHYVAGATDKTEYTTETFTQTMDVNDEVEDYIGSLTKFEFTGVGISDKGKDGTMSMKISMPTSEDAGKYVSFTFTVAPNYYLSVDNIDIQCQPVDHANHNYKVVLTDALGTTITGTSSTNTKGELNSINFPAAQLSGKRLVGLVTVKIFGWYSSSDTYRLAKNTYITGTVSSLPAPTASWTSRPASATVGDGGKTYTLTTDGTNTVAWSITDQSGAIGATLSAPSGLSTTLSGYTTAGSLYVQASVTGDGIHYLSTPATLLRQRVVISAGCVETTLISATLSSGTATGSVTGTPGGSSAVSFTSVKEVDGGYKMGGDGSYVYLTLSDDENFAANDEVKITITKASDQGDGALHIYKYADASWTELGSVTAAGAGTYTYRLTESNVSTPFNTIGLYRTGKNQNPYVKALSVVRNSCSETKPHSVSVTASPTGPSYAIDDALTLTVEATNADTYQWYSNTNNTASDGFLLVGETAITYSPSTAIAGTTYYYCVATNESGSTVSNIIEVTVNSAKTAPTVSWEDTYESPTYGGGGYAVKATVSDASWDGTLTTDMLTASDGVTLSGVSVAGKVITATYGVTETARSPLSFSLTLPETTNYTALAANKEITFDRCQADPEAVDAVTKLPVLSAYTTVNNVYRWATADVGWFTLETGASSISSESSSYSGFSYRSKSGKKYVLLYSELDAVKAVRLYVNGTGDNTTLSKVKTGTTYNKYKELEESTDYDFTYSNSSTSIASRENAYIEISFKTNLTANTFVEITLSRNTLYYGVELLTGSEVGTIDTDISWAAPAPSATVNKKTTDANFRYEAVKASDAASQATLGTISYKSSNPAVATVSATGVVDVLSVGTTTITATLAGSGCYKKATKSYNLVVAEATCTDEAGTITASGSGITIDGNTVTKADACAAVTLTVSGHTGEDDGAIYQWYKDGVSMGESYQEKSITVTDNGDYTVEVTNTGDGHCTMPATNTITITGNAISITNIVDEWYVKNGRRTPDIALATIEGTTSYTVNDGSSNITTFAGCGFELRDGILYLKGQKENGDEPSGLTEGNATLTITAVSACGDDDPTATITIHKQEETAKPSIAFIVDGTKGDPVNNVATAKTSSRPIWVYLSESFDLTGCNAYWTNNEKLIRQYYSQFDAIVITDDPSTDEKPSSGLKYVNALGTMVDVRPVLTMEAYVGKYGASSNWHIGGTPSSPNPRQYELKLQCKDHDIFFDLTPSANFRSEEIDGETYYYVTMVDNSVTPYAGLADDAETGTYPALQGFSAASIKGTGMLGIGTISDGTLQGGVERQDEPTARMMILGIQHQAMAALTSEGKQVIKNAINYLLKTDMEEVDDCSNYFIGGTAGHEQDWHTASNWSSTKVPDASTKARILVPVTISTKVHVAQVDIAVDGRSIRYDSGNTKCSGSVTIASTGALIVDGQVRRTTNGRLYTEEELQPTQIEDLTIGSDESNGNGTLIFDNSEGESQAIVQYYSKANTNENDEWNWQYMAVPFNDNSSAYRNFYDSYLYRWAENCSGWEVVPNQGVVYPWVGYTITQVGEKMYYMDGTLVETGEQTFTVPAGKNLVVGNSWTAPIQVKQFEDADFAGMSKNIYLFNTGYDPNGEGAFDQADGRYEGGTYVTIPIHSSPYTGDSLISSLQAFIVYAKTGEGGGTFTLDYDRHVRPARSTDKVNAGPMHAPERGGVINDKPAILKVWASGSRYDDRLIVLEREDFSTGLDEGWDGNKRVAGNSSPLIFAVTDNGREAVSAIPTMEGTLIGFWAGEDNEYTLHFEYDEEDELYLLDLDNNTYTPVNSNSTYVFTVPDKKAHNRFILTRNAPDPVATGVEETQANEKPEAKAIKFLKDEKVFIFVNGKLYDATGKVVK